MWIRVWGHKICFHIWIHIYEFIYEFIYVNMNSCTWIHTQTLLDTPEIICYSWIHTRMHNFIWIHDFPWIYVWIDGMNSYANPSWYPQIHCLSWIYARYYGYWHFYIGEIIFKFMSEEYREKYIENNSDFMEVLKRILNWIHQHGALTRSVWQGQPILPLLLKGNMPRVLPLQAAPDQFKFSLVTTVLVHVRVGALPKNLSESRLYDGILSQKWSGWVALINCQLEVTNAMEQGTTSSSNN